MSSLPPVSWSRSSENFLNSKLSFDNFLPASSLLLVLTISSVISSAEASPDFAVFVFTISLPCSSGTCFEGSWLVAPGTEVAVTLCLIAFFCASVNLTLFSFSYSAIWISIGSPKTLSLPAKSGSAKTAPVPINPIPAGNVPGLFNLVIPFPVADKASLAWPILPLMSFYVLPTDVIQLPSSFPH